MQAVEIDRHPLGLAEVHVAEPAAPDDFAAVVACFRVDGLRERFVMPTHEAHQLWLRGAEGLFRKAAQWARLGDGMHDQAGPR